MPTWGELKASTWALTAGPGLTLSDLIRQVNYDSREKFSNGVITDWVNRALNDLTPIAKKEEVKTSSIISSNTYEIPSDLFKIVSVITKDSSGCENEMNQISQRDRRTGYKLWGNTFTVQGGPTSGEVDLYYYRKLAKLKYPTDVPEIEEEFQDLLVLYAIGQLQFRESDDRPDALNKYYARKREYEQYINQRRAISVPIENVYSIQDIY